MKKIILIMIVVLGILITGCDNSKKDETGKLIPVMTYKAHPEKISSYIKLTGGLEAETDLDLYSMSSEKIKKIHVSEGAQVHKGKLLVEQENEIALQSVNLALAGVNNARGSLELTQKEFTRMENLYNQKAISKQQYDQILMQKNSAEAGLDLAEAQLEQARQQLDYTRIYAPSHGQIAMLYFKEGQMVPAGVPVVKIINPQKMTARLQASEMDLLKLFVNQKVLASFPALAGRNYTGKVKTIDSAIDPHSRTLEIEVELDNGMGELRSGMFGEFLLITQERQDVIVISDQAVMTRTRLLIDNDGKQITQKEYYVFLEDAQTARMQPVTTGLHSSGRLEITSGLNTGDMVIVVGQNIVKNGDKVKVVN